jgi:hypothetical protein
MPLPPLPSHTTGQFRSVGSAAFSICAVLGMKSPCPVCFRFRLRLCELVYDNISNRHKLGYIRKQTQWFVCDASSAGIELGHFYVAFVYLKATSLRDITEGICQVTHVDTVGRDINLRPC